MRILRDIVVSAVLAALIRTALVYADDRCTHTAAAWLQIIAAVMAAYIVAIKWL